MPLCGRHNRASEYPSHPRFSFLSLLCPLPAQFGPQLCLVPVLIANKGCTRLPSLRPRKVCRCAASHLASQFGQPSIFSLSLSIPGPSYSFNAMTSVNPTTAKSPNTSPAYWRIPEGLTAPERWDHLIFSHILKAPCFFLLYLRALPLACPKGAFFQRQDSGSWRPQNRVRASCSRQSCSFIPL